MHFSERVHDNVPRNWAEAIEKASALRASTDSSWETAKQDLDRQWKEIAEMKKALD
jgi:hypothetical protein